MKVKRLTLAMVVMLVLALFATGIWAAPGRQGTVPLPPSEFAGTCAPPAVVNFFTGYATVREECTFVLKHSPNFDEVKGWLQLPAELAQSDWLPENGWTVAFDFVWIHLTSGKATSEQVCVPFSPSWEGKKPGENLKWFVWDRSLFKWDDQAKKRIPQEKEWVQAETILNENTTPKQLCGTITADKLQDNPGLFEKDALFVLLVK